MKCVLPRHRNGTGAPFTIGLILVVAVVAGIAFVSRNSNQPKTEANPYAEKLQPSDLTLSAADNFVGATVTYLDMSLTNTGDRTVAGGQVEASFKNSLGEVVQKEIVPIHVLQASQLGGYPDIMDLSMSPLAAGQTKKVRLTPASMFPPIGIRRLPTSAL